MTSRKSFLWTCWFPAALWGATMVYLRPYDGWGAWAAAPLILPSLALSTFYGVWGAALVGFRAARERRIDRAVLTATAVGACEVFYYWLRYLLRPTDYGQ